MLKITTFIKRKPGMDLDEFRHYWLEIHSKIVMKMPGIKRYIQCHTLDSAYKGGKEPIYDGMAEVWFDDMEAMRRSAQTPEFKATMADEVNFMDPASRGFIITKEHHLI